MNNKKNLISALINQIATIIYGLILPRIIITTFGSEVNGMISSISQFLSFISLLEGGLGAVVLAELYYPLEQKDDEKIKDILLACHSFFTKLGIFFLCYTIVIAAVFAYAEQGFYSTTFVVLLVVILSISTLSQYLFAITSKLLLQANQKIYIINNISTFTLIFNLIVAILVVKFFPSVLLLKAGAAFAFLVQPLALNRFIEKKYKIPVWSLKSKYLLKNRRSGFGQNLAHFINMNTDIAVVTIFINLKEVSVYSVYMLPINALRSIVCSIDNSFQSVIGKYYVENNDNKLVSTFKSFFEINALFSIVLFNTCILLINPFINLYVGGVNDADYYRPVFSIVMCLANLLYCIREPLRLTVLASGRFKETNNGAYIEAVINILVSVVLVRYYGLTGIAIGTLCAILYRTLYLYNYFRKDILNIPIRYFLHLNIRYIVLIVLNLFLYNIVMIPVNSFIQFCVIGLGLFLFEFTLAILVLGKINDLKLYIQKMKKSLDH